MNYRKPLQLRFAKLSKLDKSGCILWTGKTKKNGYGYITIGPKEYRAHRVAYEFYIGPIPNNLVLDHLCKTKNCINPKHLEPVPQRTNLARSNNPIGQRIAKFDSKQ